MTTAQEVVARMDAASTLTNEWWQAGIAKVLSLYAALIDLHRLDLDRELVAARIWYETRGNPNVVSTDPVLREVGLLQLSKDSQAQYGVTDAKDPEQNIRAGCLLWSRWSQSFRAWALAKPLALDSQGSAGDFAMTWLVTAIGPGAIRELCTEAGAATFAGMSAWVRGQTAAYLKLHSTGKLGRATADATAYRIAVAGRAGAVALSMNKEGGFMSIGQAALFASVVAGVALLAFWVWPGGAS